MAHRKAQLSIENLRGETEPDEKGKSALKERVEEGKKGKGRSRPVEGSGAFSRATGGTIPGEEQSHSW